LDAPLLWMPGTVAPIAPLCTPLSQNQLDGWWGGWEYNDWEHYVVIKRKVQSKVIPVH